MIRMTVLYPAADDASFDHDYYRNTHVPMCTDAWGCTAQIDKGINGPYLAAVHLMFDSMEQYESAMSSDKTSAIMGDVPNYTNTTPILQVSEVVE